MSETPTDAILESLLDLGEILETSAPSPSGWQTMRVRGNPHGLKRSSFQILEERSSVPRVVSAVTYEDASSRPWLMIFHVLKNADGQWKVVGSAGGGDDRMIRPSPWVNLAGGGWPDMFYAGGRVEDNGVGVTGVRIIDSKGLVVEDTNESGVVLFLSEERVEMPLTVELYARDEVISSHSWGRL